MAMTLEKFRRLTKDVPGNTNLFVVLTNGSAPHVHSVEVASYENNEGDDVYSVTLLPMPAPKVD